MHDLTDSLTNTRRESAYKNNMMGSMITIASCCLQPFILSKQLLFFWVVFFFFPLSAPCFFNVWLGKNVVWQKFVFLSFFLSFFPLLSIFLSPTLLRPSRICHIVKSNYFLHVVTVVRCLRRCVVLERC